jgi:hypothetical protein
VESMESVAMLEIVPPYPVTAVAQHYYGLYAVSSMKTCSERIAAVRS